MNGATETTVEQGPTVVDGIYFQARVSVPPTHADAYATPVLTAKKDGELQATDKGLDCLIWDVTKNVWKR